MSRPGAPRRGIVEALNRTFRHWSLLPAVLLFLLLTVYPMANLARMSLSTITFADGTAHWAWTPLANLQLLTNDAVLGAAAFNTAVFVVVAVAFEMALGLALALLVARLSRGKGLARTVMVLPILVPPVAIGSMWKLMYNYDFGVFNQVADGDRACAGELARVDQRGADVGDHGRRLALGAVHLPDPVRGGRRRCPPT